MHQFEKQIREIVAPEDLGQQFQFMGAGGSVPKVTQTEYPAIRKISAQSLSPQFANESPPDLPKQAFPQAQMGLSSPVREKKALDQSAAVADKTLPLLPQKKLPQKKPLLKSQMAKKDICLETSAVRVGKKQPRQSESRKIIARKNLVPPCPVRASRKHKAKADPPKYDADPSPMVSRFQKPLETINAGKVSILEIIKSTEQSVRDVME